MDMINVQEIRNELCAAFEKKIDLADREILIFGAGNTALLYESCFKTEGISPLYFIDNNPVKHGKTFQGKKIINLEEVKSVCGNPVILICSTKPEVCKNMIEMIKHDGAYESYIVDEYVFTKHSEQILQVFDLLEDAVSKQTYADMILSRMCRKTLNYDLVFGNQYFELKDFMLRDSSEIFVDCGAYVGDTVEQYLTVKSGVFGKIYAFEPDEINYKALGYRLERLKKEWAIEDNKMIMIFGGVGGKTTQMRMRQTENGKDRLGSGFLPDSERTDAGIHIYAIDDYFAELPVSFIKADIESFEELMIQGAKNVIKRDKPKMAICIYHNPSDMYRLPLLIKEINENYRFDVRQHYCDISETVLYVY